MGNPQEQSYIQALIDDRGREYGEAWMLTGRVINLILIHLPVRPPSEYLWAIFMVINKAIRALWSPTNPEHWIDIQGYAQLAINRARLERLRDEAFKNSGEEDGT